MDRVVVLECETKVGTDGTNTTKLRGTKKICVRNPCSTREMDLLREWGGRMVVEIGLLRMSSKSKV